jgi:hypothetical protein
MQNDKNLTHSSTLSSYRKVSLARMSINCDLGLCKFDFSKSKHMMKPYNFSKSSRLSSIPRGRERLSRKLLLISLHIIIGIQEKIEESYNVARLGVVTKRFSGSLGGSRIFPLKRALGGEKRILLSKRLSVKVESGICLTNWSDFLKAHSLLVLEFRGKGYASLAT